MPAAPRRTANSAVTIDSAALDTQYSARSTEAAWALEEVIVTMLRWARAPGRPSSRLANACVRKKVPRVLTVRQWSNAWGLTSSRSPRVSTVTPALFTRQASGPRARSASSSMGPCVATSARSPLSATPRAPRRSTSSSVSASASPAFRSISATSKPASARPSASAWPMPPPAPVTSAVARAASTGDGDAAAADVRVFDMRQL